MRGLLLILFCLFPLFVGAEPWYHSSSPWRTPIGPASKVLDDSVYYVDGDPSKGLKAFQGLTLTSDPSQYTYPVHYVDNSMPAVTLAFDNGVLSEVQDTDGDGDEDVTLRHRWGRGTIDIRIDPTASYPIPSGSDRQFILVNRDTGQEVGVWQAQDADGDGLWEPWQGDSATNGYSYNANWLAYPPTILEDNNHHFMSRGAGVPYGAGLIRREEIEAGKIEHVVAFAFPKNHDTAWMFPATRTDGYKFSGDGPLGDTIAEGQLLQLDPAYRQSAGYASLSTVAKIVADALIDYGMISVDNSGSSKVIVEHESTAKWSELPADLQITRSALSSIPMDQFRLIESPYEFNTLVDIHEYDPDSPEPTDDLAALEQRIAALEEILGSLQESVTTIDTRLTALEEIASSGDMTIIKNSIMDLDNRVQSIEKILEAVRNAWGFPLESNTSAVLPESDLAIPEPSTVVLILVSTVVWGCRMWCQGF